MENSVSSFILLIVTVLIGIVAIGLSAVFASNQYNASLIQSQAQNIANGLYISVSNPAIMSNGYAVFITVKDFNYQGSLYFTVFYISNVFRNASSQISPSLAYILNGKIVYPRNVKIGNSVPPYITATTLYYTNLNLMYQGNPIILWQTPPLTSPIDISLVLSPPQGYSAVILFFAQIQNKYIEVGYEWL